MSKCTECPNVLEMRHEKCPNVPSLWGHLSFRTCSNVHNSSLECPECQAPHDAECHDNRHKCLTCPNIATTLRIPNVTNHPTSDLLSEHVHAMCKTCPNVRLPVIIPNQSKCRWMSRMSEWFPNGPNVHYIRMSKCPHVRMSKSRPKICLNVRMSKVSR